MAYIQAFIFALKIDLRVTYWFLGGSKIIWFKSNRFCGKNCVIGIYTTSRQWLHTFIFIFKRFFNSNNVSNQVIVDLPFQLMFLCLQNRSYFPKHFFHHHNALFVAVGLRRKQEKLMNFTKHAVIESIAKRNKTCNIVRTEH